MTVVVGKHFTFFLIVVSWLGKLAIQLAFLSAVRKRRRHHITSAGFSPDALQARSVVTWVGNGASGALWLGQVCHLSLFLALDHQVDDLHSYGYGSN